MLAISRTRLAHKRKTLNLPIITNQTAPPSIGIETSSVEIHKIVCLFTLHSGRRQPPHAPWPPAPRPRRKFLGEVAGMVIQGKQHILSYIFKFKLNIFKYIYASSLDAFVILRLLSSIMNTAKLFFWTENGIYFYVSSDFYGFHNFYHTI